MSRERVSLAIASTVLAGLAIGGGYGVVHESSASGSNLKKVPGIELQVAETLPEVERGIVVYLADKAENLLNSAGTEFDAVLPLQDAVHKVEADKLLNQRQKMQIRNAEQDLSRSKSENTTAGKLGVVTALISLAGTMGVIGQLLIPRRRRVTI